LDAKTQQNLRLFLFEIAKGASLHNLISYFATPFLNKFWVVINSSFIPLKVPGGDKFKKGIL